jgi:hypothetical protein
MSMRSPSRLAGYDLPERESHRSGQSTERLRFRGQRFLAGALTIRVWAVGEPQPCIWRPAAWSSSWLTEMVGRGLLRRRIGLRHRPRRYEPASTGGIRTTWVSWGSMSVRISIRGLRVRERSRLSIPNPAQRRCTLSLAGRPGDNSGGCHHRTVLPAAAKLPSRRPGRL